MVPTQIQLLLVHYEAGGQAHVEKENGVRP